MLINKGYIKKSDIHGYGVFAKEDIKEGDIVEQALCPTQILEPKYIYIDGKVTIENVDSMSSYRFAAPDSLEYWVIPMGNAMCYNHNSEPNLEWTHSIEERFIVFTAIKDIKKGEELCTDYGPRYSYKRLRK